MENYDMLREMFNKSPIGTLFYDKNGSLIDLNPAILQIVGLKEKEELQSLNIFDNPYLAPLKEKLLTEGTLKFQSPIDFENIRKMGFYNSSRTGVGYLDYVITVTDFGYLMQIQDITESTK